MVRAHTSGIPRILETNIEPTREAQCHEEVKIYGARKQNRRNGREFEIGC